MDVVFHSDPHHTPSTWYEYQTSLSRPLPCALIPSPFTCFRSYPRGSLDSSSLSMQAGFHSHLGTSRVSGPSHNASPRSSLRHHQCDFLCFFAQQTPSFPFLSPTFQATPALSFSASLPAVSSGPSALGPRSSFAFLVSATLLAPPAPWPRLQPFPT